MASTEPKNNSALSTLGILEEDDEFDEFPVEDWDETAENKLDVEQWEADWDDDNLDDDFSKQLRTELERAAAATAVETTASKKHYPSRSYERQHEGGGPGKGMMQRQIEAARIELGKNPWNSNAIKTLIDCYRQLGDHESVKGAWSHLMEITPLSASEWLQYYDDVPDSLIPPRRICNVDVWKRFLKISCTPDTINLALEACKYHTSRGHELWIEFGNPIEGLQYPYKEHKALEEATGQPYPQELLSILPAIINVEDKLDESESSFMAAIELLNEDGDENSVMVAIKTALYQRALGQDDLLHSPTLWSFFLNFSHRFNQMDPNLILAAVMACRKSFDLRQQIFLLVELEIHNLPSVEYMEETLALLLQGYDPDSIDNVVELHLLFAAFIRRSLWRHGDKERGRERFAQLVKTLREIGPDPHSRVERFWIRLEYSQGDVNIGRDILFNLLESTYLNDVKWWLEAIWLGISIQNYPQVRDLFDKAKLNVSANDALRLAKEWESFELQYGDAKGYKDCLEWKKHQVPKARIISDKKHGLPPPKGPQSKRFKAEEIEYDPDRTIFLSNLSFKATEAQITSFMNDTIGKVEMVTLSRDKNGRSRGLAHVMFCDNSSAIKALSHDRVMFLGRPLFINQYQAIPYNQRKGVSYSSGRDPKVLYISNLTEDTLKDDLEGLCRQFAGLVAVRPILTKSGHFKRAAYVEFEDEESAQPALSLDGHLLKGNKIRVQISDPEAAHNKKTSLQMLPRNVNRMGHAKPKVNL